LSRATGEAVVPARWVSGFAACHAGLVTYSGRVKTRLASLVLLASLTGSALAQIRVDLVLDQNQFLPGEAIPVAVRITNFSGLTLRLGHSSDWLRFTVETKDGYLVPHDGEVPVAGEFELENSTVATKRVDVAPTFALKKPGPYRISATIKPANWDKELVTPTRSFEIFAGTVLWEQAFGVPPPAGSANPPEVRRYLLQQAIHLKELKLYVRVTDQRGEKTFAAFPLGPMLSFSQPEKQIDKQSQLHVLYQVGARSFNYSVINPDGKLVARQTHEYTDTRPVLRADRAGEIGVSGGLRRLSRDDLPSPEPNPGAPPALSAPPAAAVN